MLGELSFRFHGHIETKVLLKVQHLILKELCKYRTIKDYLLF